MLDYARQEFLEGQYPPLVIEAPAKGLKVTCGKEEYCCSTFADLLRILDDLITTDCGGAFEISNKFAGRDDLRLREASKPIEDGTLRLEKVGVPA